jgi:hypothetical protein
MAGYVDAFEKAGILREFIGVLDYVDSALAIVERYRPPPVIVRTLIHDGFRMLDDFARAYRGLFKCTTTNKVFNADLIAARNILITATSNNTSMTPVTPRVPERDRGNGRRPGQGLNPIGGM